MASFTPNVATPPTKVTLTYLGAAGWQITDGTFVILVDPYLTRVPARTDTSRGPASEFEPRIDVTQALVTDTAAVDAHITRANFILVHHTHFDHVMDVPYIARRTRATVIGSESAANLMRSFGLPAAQIIPVQGGEDYQFGRFSLRVIPSLHAALANKHYIDTRVIPPTLHPPLRYGDYAEGRDFAYLIRFDGHEILTFGSANYIERELDGLRPEVVLVGVPGREQIHDYTARLMHVLGNPPLVLPTHFDNHLEAIGRAGTIGNLPGFIDEVRAASPTTRVIVPKYFEPIELPSR